VETIFLGTAGSFPTAERGAPCLAVRREGELLLFDCGEGTQRQMIKARMGLKADMRILITHMHGDHVLGLPGILQTMALFDRTAPLRVYGPPGVCAFIKAFKETVKFGLSYPIEVTEVDEGIVYEEEEYHIECAQMQHQVPSLGYALVETDRPGRFYPTKAESLGVPRGPLWRELQKGRAVTGSAGITVRSEQVMGPTRTGRKLVYTGDTSPCMATVALAEDADLLIHEATLSDDLQDKALEAGHSTPSQAAEVAQKAHARRLVLTHISARYTETLDYLERARRIFPGIVLAEDFMSFEVPLRD
jgi:ribonuclease Z